ncbi:MAG: hypothetical protein DMF56_27110 [Acidobacteria bacterium]|nr:MAG: hypothetical protein DMF56_27110 [Acidobacteriota bacterium]
MRALSWTLLLLALAVPPDACGHCPANSTTHELYVATVTTPCTMTVAVGQDIVTYTSRCGAPEFHSVVECQAKPAEAPR